MKLKQLHPRKSFLKFLSLAILVLGASVGVVLATQKDPLLFGSKASVPIVVCGGMGAGEARCENNHLITLSNNGKICREIDCGKDCYMKGVCKECVINGKGKGECRLIQHQTYKPYTSEPITKPTTAPKPTTGPCSQSCIARIECTENAGTVISGTCSGGRVCCDF